jgi:hypothetical protein
MAKVAVIMCDGKLVGDIELEQILPLLHQRMIKSALEKRLSTIIR